MTGSGGAVGAMVTQLLFFSSSKYSKETGITLMGVMVVICSLSVGLIHFPQWGGMLCGPSAGLISTKDDYYLLE